jgi:hypothetical protein
MPVPTLPRIGRGKVRIVSVGAAALVAVAVAASGPLRPAAPVSEASPVEAPDKGICTVDVSYPIEVRIVPSGSAKPGGLVSADIEIEARRLIDDVRVTVDAAPGIDLLSARTVALGTLGAWEPSRAPLSIRLPGDTRRRTVTVRVDASVDGVPFSRLAVWNLLPDGGEVSRVVVTADGRSVREVRGTEVPR